MKELKLRALNFQLPESWVDTSSLGGASPLEGGYRASVVATLEVLNAVDLAAYVREHSDNLSGDLKQYHVYTREPRQLAGRPAHVLEHSFETEDGDVLRQLQVFFQRDNDVFIVSCTHGMKRFEESRARFEEVLATVQMG